MSFPRPIRTFQMTAHWNFFSFYVIEGKDSVEFQHNKQGSTIIKVNGVFPKGSYTRDSWDRVKNSMSERGKGTT